MAPDLVRSIYEACLEPERWRAAVDRIAQAVGGCGGQLMLWDEARAAPLFNLSVGAANPDAGRLFESYYGAIDPRRQYAMTRPVGEWNACHRICDDKFVAGSEFYQDYLIPTVGCRYMAGVRLAADDGLHAMLAVGRRADQRAAPFEATDLSLLRALTPHLRLAVRIQNRIGQLEERAALREEALDLLAMAVFTVDRNTAVRYSNASADALLKDGRGPLIGRSGRLQARTPRATAALEAAVKAAVDCGVGGGLALASEEGRGSNCGLLQALFRLTASEAGLAASLAAGCTLETVAAERGVSILTARAHLRAVFAKVGVNRQGELMALLERLSQLTARRDPVPPRGP